MKVLVTGAAGFIGFHTASHLLARGDDVVGLDVVNDYYDPALKEARLRSLSDQSRKGRESGLSHAVIWLMAMPSNACFLSMGSTGSSILLLRPACDTRCLIPKSYVQSNLVGFTNVLEACRRHSSAHLTYASTSSVYGANTRMPFSEHRGTNHPLQFYAATKRANELMAHAYSHLFRLPTTGLRFFTVYGPWGRPDMALFLFTKNILEGKPIKLFNQGRHSRDFTYVDDIVECVVRVSDSPAAPDPSWRGDAPDPATSNAPFRIYNIGNNKPVELLEYVAAIEEATGRKSIREYLPMQPGDVPDTWADVSDLEREMGYRPNTPVREGVARFVNWYRSYYGV